MKNKLNIVFYITIVILTLIAGLEGMYILRNNKTPVEKEIIKYTGQQFLKENITYQKSDVLSINAQIYKNNNLLLIRAKTGKKSIANSKIFVEFYDEKEKLVTKEECDINILESNEEYVCIKGLPLMTDDTYAGKIIISSETDSYETDTKLHDKNLLDFKSSQIVDEETKITTLNFESENPYDELNYFDGYVLVSKKDKILDAIYFNISTSKVENDMINFSVLTGPSIENSEIKVTDYDKLEVIINNLY